jgi:hypothetical protein
MRLSPARLAANRANAARSTGPRTPAGKVISSRNALTHGAYASDETLLALATALADADPNLPRSAQPIGPTPSTGTPGTSAASAAVADLPHERPQSPRLCHPTAVGGPGTPPPPPQPAAAGTVAAIRPQPEVHNAAASPAIPSQPEATTSYLADLTAQYQPVGTIETILIRRLAALALRLDRLNEAIIALPALGERRALVDHLLERYAIDAECGSLRDQPDWRGPLRRYDDPAYVNPYPEDVVDDPARDPDPALCATVYTLSSRRAETFSRLETTAGRAFVTTLNQLRAEQAARRRAALYPPTDLTPEQALFNATGHRLPITPGPTLPSSPLHPAAPAPATTPPVPETPIDRNEPTAATPPGPSADAGNNLITTTPPETAADRGNEPTSTPSSGAGPRRGNEPIAPTLSSPVAHCGNEPTPATPGPHPASAAAPAAIASPSQPAAFPDPVAAHAGLAAGLTQDHPAPGHPHPDPSPMPSTTVGNNDAIIPIRRTE